MSGTPEVGSTLTAAGGSWTGVPAVGLQWERCTARRRLHLRPGRHRGDLRRDGGRRRRALRVVESATNAGGTATAASPVSTDCAARPGRRARRRRRSSRLPRLRPRRPPNVRTLLGTTLRRERRGGEDRHAGPHRPLLDVLHRAHRRPPHRPLVLDPEAGPKAKLLASARVTFTAAGRKRVVVRLTRAGKRALRRAKRQLRVRVVAIWVPQGSPSVTVTRRLTLKR